ncbi:MAG TPA: ATP12 family protein [Alphaproteobacteria bacterium]|nr:ATP12 family protein [Alphaproteobacteria bacterium]
MRRVYNEVRVAVAGDGFAVTLDGKTLTTPAGTPIVAPTRALATAIAAEWASQSDRIRFETAPLTRIASTALDRVAARRAELRRELAAYGETELVCHRAERPPDLVARQRAAWQPLVDWLADRFDVRLVSTQGVVARAQPQASLAALARALEAYDDWRLAALSVAVGAAGSLAIGLALVESRLDPGQAFEAAELDASYQIEAWGEDRESMRRRAEVRADLESAARFIALANAV